MDTFFHFNEAERQVFLQQLMHSFGCTYICLWSYLPQPSNCLLFLDGVHRELMNNQGSTSLSSGSRRLFDVYRGLLHDVDNGRIPGFAFKNKLPYMELKLHDFQRLASHDLQRQFYQEARIQTVVFMGCGTGEIELGLSNDPIVDIEMEMRNFISLKSSQQFISPLVNGELIPSSSSSQPFDQNQAPPPLSPSPSSLRSLSVDSIDQYSPIPFSIIPQTSSSSSSLIQEIPKQALNIIDHHHTHDLSQIVNIQLPTRDIEDAAMTKAILAVLSSSPSTSSSSPNFVLQTTAFRSYGSRITSTIQVDPAQFRVRRNNGMFKRAVLFFRNLNMIRRQELNSMQGNQPNPTQLHHTISERKRREKLNESFQVLRSLLPPGSKKDKASVLSTTADYLSTLKSQVEELRKRNQMLEAELVSKQSSEDHDKFSGLISSMSSERTSVEISQVSKSLNSEERFLDLRVAARGDQCNMLDIVVGILGFLKRRRRMRISSIESNTRMVESNPVHMIVMRLNIEGSEFDESIIQEAVKRVVGDLAR